MSFFLLGAAQALSTSNNNNNHQQQLHFFIGGLGYCGARLAARLRQEFPLSEISGCVRSPDSQRIKQTALNDIQCRVHVLDLDQNYVGLDADGERDLSRATHIIQTIAPLADFDRDPLLALHRNVLQGSSHLHWVGYLSSTGVYGDHQGEWVDEDSSPLKCQDAKSLARVQAEQEWRTLEKQPELICVDCFRCGGIYGPGRGPLFSPASGNSRSRSDNPDDDAIIDNDPPKYVNRILVDDICAALVAVIRTTLPEEATRENGDSRPAVKRGLGSVYNLVDDDPAPRRTVVKHVQQILLQPSSDNQQQESNNGPEEGAGGETPTKAPTRMYDTEVRSKSGTPVAAESSGVEVAGTTLTSKATPSCDGVCNLAASCEDSIVGTQNVTTPHSVPVLLVVLDPIPGDRQY
eukprot:scaffold1007_cov176-Amphora_coffeaeformis.AAC.23